VSEYSPEDQALIDQIHAEHEALPGDERLWRWFGLSRASWLTMPRSLMHAMPEEWQGKMARLLEEFDDEFPRWCQQQLYVNAKERGRYAELPEVLCNYRHPDRAAIDSLRRPA
jgi:hypothetical protein